MQVESIRQPVLTISERLDIVIEKEGLRTAGLNQHIGLMGKGNLRSEAAPNMRDIIIPALSQWATGRDPIRAVLLTSTRAIPDAPIDALSDYDVILIVHDIQPFVAERAWLNAFGELLVVYWEPVHPDPIFGIEHCSNVTQYADGLKIDFTLWPVTLLQKIVAAPELPAELDAGYRVLLDKGRSDCCPALTDVHCLCARAALPRNLSDPDQRFLERCALRCQVPPARRSIARQVVPGLRHEAHLSAAVA